MIRKLFVGFLISQGIFTSAYQTSSSYSDSAFGASSSYSSYTSSGAASTNSGFTDLYNTNSRLLAPCNYSQHGDLAAYTNLNQQNQHLTGAGSAPGLVRVPGTNNVIINGQQASVYDLPSANGETLFFWNDANSPLYKAFQASKGCFNPSPACSNLQIDTSFAEDFLKKHNIQLPRSGCNEYGCRYSGEIDLSDDKGTGKLKYNSANGAVDYDHGNVKGHSEFSSSSVNSHYSSTCVNGVCTGGSGVNPLDNEILSDKLLQGGVQGTTVAGFDGLDFTKNFLNQVNTLKQQTGHISFQNGQIILPDGGAIPTGAFQGSTKQNANLATGSYQASGAFPSGQVTFVPQGFSTTKQQFGSTGQFGAASTTQNLNSNPSYQFQPQQPQRQQPQPQRQQPQPQRQQQAQTFGNQISFNKKQNTNFGSLPTQTTPLGSPSPYQNQATFNFNQNKDQTAQNTFIQTNQPQGTSPFPGSSKATTPVYPSENYNQQNFYEPHAPPCLNQPGAQCFGNVNIIDSQYLQNQHNENDYQQKQPIPTYQSQNTQTNQGFKQTTIYKPQRPSGFVANTTPGSVSQGSSAYTGGFTGGYTGQVRETYPTIVPSTTYRPSTVGSSKCGENFICVGKSLCVNGVYRSTDQIHLKTLPRVCKSYETCCFVLDQPRDYQQTNQLDVENINNYRGSSTGSNTGVTTSSFSSSGSFASNFDAKYEQTNQYTSGQPIKSSTPVFGSSTYAIGSSSSGANNLGVSQNQGAFGTGTTPVFNSPSTVVGSNFNSLFTNNNKLNRDQLTGQPSLIVPVKGSPNSFDGFSGYTYPPPKKEFNYEQSGNKPQESIYPGTGYLPPNDYLPPKPTTQAPEYLPPEVTGSEIEGENLPPENEQKPSNTNTERIPLPTTPRYEPAPIVPVECAAALNCTPVEYCQADGFISPTIVRLTPEEEQYRAPLTDCLIIKTGQPGKCCRDGNYKDPWPVGQLGLWNPDNGFDDGSYKADTNGNYVSPGRLNTFNALSDADVSGTSIGNPQFVKRPSRNEVTGSTLDGCGIRKPNGRPKGNAPGDAAFGEIPWQVMILRDSNRSLLCGGAVIRDDVVLTGAHCVDREQTSDILVKVGEWRLGIDAEPKPFQIAKVKAIVVHPQYNSLTGVNDMALLFLGEKIRYDSHVGALCLPKSADDVEAQLAAASGRGNCIVTGWGKEVLRIHIGNSLPHVMPITVLQPDQCQYELSTRHENDAHRYHTINNVCGRPQLPNNDVCNVDPGSALACDLGDGRYTLSGVFSWDTGCLAPSQTSDSQIASFTRIDYNWLTGMLRKAIQQVVKESKDYKPIPSNGYAGSVNSNINRGSFETPSGSQGLTSGSGLRAETFNQGFVNGLKGSRGLSRQQQAIYLAQQRQQEVADGFSSIKTSQTSQNVGFTSNYQTNALKKRQLE